MKQVNKLNQKREGEKKRLNYKKCNNNRHKMWLNFNNQYRLNQKNNQQKDKNNKKEVKEVKYKQKNL